MSSKLIIVFVKNNQPGKVKTRLAKTIGNEAASHIYDHLVKTTLESVNEVKADKHIYFSNYTEDASFSQHERYVQEGEDLGSRMLNAFEKGFDKGYEEIVLIGSDLPDLSSTLIENAFHKLKVNDLVFGPAEDGGYYLIAMKNLITKVFLNKPWSQSKLLEITLNELQETNFKVALLETLNDIDTFEDLKQYPNLLSVISKYG